MACGGAVQRVGLGGCGEGEIKGVESRGRYD